MTPEEVLWMIDKLIAYHIEKNGEYHKRYNPSAPSEEDYYRNGAINALSELRSVISRRFVEGKWKGGENENLRCMW